MANERDHLITVVYPELEERLVQLNLSFFDVDLRWGLPSEIDGGPVDVWRECAARIDEAEPLFVGLLGARYGTPACAEELNELERALWGKGKSYTELEIRYAAFKERPPDAPKEKIERRSAFFLCEAPICEPEDRGQKSLREAVRTFSTRRRKHGPWTPVRHYSAQQLDSFGRMLLEDVWRQILTHPAYFDQALWREVVPNRARRRRLLTDETPLPEKIWSAFVATVRRARTPLEIEDLDLRRFRAERIQHFAGRASQINEAVAHLKGERDAGSGVRTVFEPPGRGKTAFMCEVARLIEAEGDVELIDCFVGAADRLATVSGMLSRFIARLEPSHPLADPVRARAAQQRQLEGAVLGALGRCRRKVAILVDGLDQLADGDALNWLPKSPRPGLRILIARADLRFTERAEKSDRNDSISFEKAWCAARLKLPALSTNEIGEISSRMMADYGKTFSAHQINAIASIDAAREPLYLTVLLRDLRTMSGVNVYQRIDAEIRSAQVEAATATQLFSRLLGRVDAFGRDFVNNWTLALSLARDGLPPMALARLTETHSAGGAAASHRIQRALRPYLQRRGGRIAYYHRDLTFAATQRPDAPPTKAAHAAIAAALQSTWAQSAKTEEDARAMAEQLYHLAEARDWEAALDLLGNDEMISSWLALPNGGQSFAEDMRRAYRIAQDDSETAIAKKLVAALLRILGSPLAAQTSFTLNRLNAWLSYRKDAAIFDALIDEAAMPNQPIEAITTLQDPRQRDLAYRARSRFAGRLRRGVGAHAGIDPDARLDLAEKMLEDLLGVSSGKPPGRAARLLDRLRRVMRRTDDRLGIDAYELAYIHFLRGDLEPARAWFLQGAHFSAAAGAEVGMWISYLLATNCRFVARYDKTEARRAVRTLKKARKALTKAAEKGDPDAQRWIMITVAFGLEAAAVLNDKQEVRALHVALRGDPWIGQFDADQNVLIRFDALSAELLEGPEAAVPIYEALMAQTGDREEQKARYAWRYGLMLKACGRTDRAAEIWQAAKAYPEHAGNRPWQARIQSDLERL